MTDVKEVELKDFDPNAEYRGSKDDRGSKSKKRPTGRPGYNPVTIGDYQVCCHMDWEDTFIVTFIYLAIWLAIFGFFGLLLKAALMTDERHTSLWMFFYTFVIMVGFVAGAVGTAKKAKAVNNDDDDDGDKEEA